MALAARGAKLVLSARREAALSAVAAKLPRSDDVMVLPLDVTGGTEALQAAVTLANAAFDGHGVDILVRSFSQSPHLCAVLCPQLATPPPPLTTRARGEEGTGRSTWRGAASVVGRMRWAWRRTARSCSSTRWLPWLSPRYAELCCAPYTRGGCVCVRSAQVYISTSQCDGCVRRPPRDM